jgi:hypothetical protein
VDSKPVELLESEEFQKTIMVGMDERQRIAIRIILDNIIESEKNKFGIPVLSGTIASHLGLTLLFVNCLDKESNSVVLADMLGVTNLAVKKWIGRLRDECGCSIPWEATGKGWKGQYAVHHWGIFDQKVFLAFEPYAQACIKDWMANSDPKIHI